LENLNARASAARPKIAVIGGGASGLVSAWLMRGDAEVTLYERSEALGGHAQSIDIDTAAGRVTVDTGFRYFFPTTYPNLLALLSALGVPWKEHQSTVTFRTGDDRTIVTPPRSAAQLLRLLASPRDILCALSFLWFVQAGRGVVRRGDWSLSLDQYLDRAQVPRWVARCYLVPMLAGCWGAPIEAMRRFPAYDVLKVLRQGKIGGVGFLNIVGGARAYVAALARGLAKVDLRTGEPVRCVERRGASWGVRGGSGREDLFDAVVLATPAWDVPGLFRDNARPAIAEVARGFSWFPTEITVHRDRALLPSRREDWGSMNLRFDGARVWSTEWSGKERNVDVFRTWMQRGDPEPRELLHRVAFRHLLVDEGSRARQLEIARLQGADGVYLAGMYTTDIDNHESAVSSAITVAKALTPRSHDLARVLARG
jgi:predicted NAD/FAD-binding protein